MKNKQPLIHVWQKLGGWCNLTMTTKYKSGNGLTPSAANRPAFPSANPLQTIRNSFTKRFYDI